MNNTFKALFVAVAVIGMTASPLSYGCGAASSGDGGIVNWGNGGDEGNGTTNPGTPNPGWGLITADRTSITVGDTVNLSVYRIDNDSTSNGVALVYSTDSGFDAYYNNVYNTSPSVDPYKVTSNSPNSAFGTTVGFSGWNGGAWNIGGNIFTKATSFTFTPTTPGTYFLHGFVADYSIWIGTGFWIPLADNANDTYENSGNYVSSAVIVTVSNPPAQPPSASIWADSTNITVGQATTIHATYAAGANDSLAATNIDQPEGVGCPGLDYNSPSNKDYVFAPSAPGSYTFYARIVTPNFNWASYGTVTVNVGAPSAPTASIWADSNNIRVGQSTTVHATFSPSSGDTLLESTIDQPEGAGCPGLGTSPGPKDYSFPASNAGTYIFFARARTSYYGSWGSYGTTTVTVGKAGTSTMVNAQVPGSVTNKFPTDTVVLNGSVISDYGTSLGTPTYTVTAVSNISGANISVGQSVGSNFTVGGTVGELPYPATGVGTVTIRAHFDGDNNYTASEQSITLQFVNQQYDRTVHAKAYPPNGLESWLTPSDEKQATYHIERQR